MDFQFSVLRIRKGYMLRKRSENLLHFSPKWRCNFLHFYLQLLVLLLCKKQLKPKLTCHFIHLVVLLTLPDFLHQV